MSLNLGTLFLDIRVAGNSNLDRVQNKLIALERTTHRLGGVLATALAIKGTTSLIDSYTETTNRIRIASKSLEEFNTSQAEVSRVALATGSDLESTALLFSRMTVATEGLGVSSKRVNRVVETIAKSVAIGGSNAQEAAGALRQFTQLLANPGASAQELNSILEQTPGLAKAMSEGLGIAQKDLKRAFRDGEVDAERLFTALESMSQKTDERFESISFTFGQAMTNLQTGAKKAFGEVNDLLGISDDFFTLMTDLSEWLSSKGSEVLAKFFLVPKMEAQKFGEFLERNFPGILDDLGRSVENLANFFVDAFKNAWSNIKTITKIGVVEILTALDTREKLRQGVGKSLVGAFKGFFKGMSQSGGTDLADALTKGLLGASEEVKGAYDETVASIVEVRKVRLAMIDAILGETSADEKRLEIMYKSLKADLQKKEAAKIALNAQTANNEAMIQGVGIMGAMSEAIQKLIAVGELWSKALYSDFEKLQKIMQSFSSQVESTLGSSLEALFQGKTESIAEMWKNMLNRMVAQALAARLTGKLFGDNGMGGLLGGLTNSGGKVNAFGQFLSGLGGAFASGGNPPVGKASLVGERGPELFVPRSAGTIIPNDQLGKGGKQVVQNFYISTPDASSFRKSRARVAADMRSAL